MESDSRAEGERWTVEETEPGWYEWETEHPPSGTYVRVSALLIAQERAEKAERERDEAVKRAEMVGQNCDELHKRCREAASRAEAAEQRVAELEKALRIAEDELRRLDELSPDIDDYKANETPEDIGSAHIDYFFGVNQVAGYVHGVLNDVAESVDEAKSISQSSTSSPNPPETEGSG